jgi:hypothetical protein
MLLNLKYKLIFSNLIDHFKTHDISLLNEVIQVFKQLKAILGEVEYSNHLHGYLEMQNHTYMREIIDIYTIIFDDSPKLPHEFDFEQSIRLLWRISHNKLQAVRTTSVRWLDKILVLVENEDQSCKDKVRHEFIKLLRSINYCNSPMMSLSSKKWAWSISLSRMRWTAKNWSLIFRSFLKMKLKTTNPFLEQTQIASMM